MYVISDQCLKRRPADQLQKLSKVYVNAVSVLSGCGWVCTLLTKVWMDAFWPEIFLSCRFTLSGSIVFRVQLFI